jgi:CRP/FNR family cyclic AMP-dependent transcriptional regulator
MAETTFDFELLAEGGFPLKRFAADEKIFVQDDDGDCMYVVRSGTVGITSGGAVLETVGPNGTFGEMTLMDGSPRSATAIAREPTEVAVINEKAFLFLVQKNPAFALDLMRQLAKRLRRMNESL